MLTSDLTLPYATLTLLGALYPSFACLSVFNKPNCTSSLFLLRDWRHSSGVAGVSMELCAVPAQLTVSVTTTLFVKWVLLDVVKPRWGHKNQGLTALWGRDLEIDTWEKSHVKIEAELQWCIHERLVRLPRITGSSCQPRGRHPVDLRSELSGGISLMTCWLLASRTEREHTFGRTFFFFLLNLR